MFEEFALEDLFRRQCILKEYLQEKMYEEDWHGVSDAANDLRVLGERIKCREEDMDRKATLAKKMHEALKEEDDSKEEEE